GVRGRCASTATARALPHRTRRALGLRDAGPVSLCPSVSLPLRRDRPDCLYLGSFLMLSNRSTRLAGLLRRSFATVAAAVLACNVAAAAPAVDVAAELARFRA